MRRGGTGFWVAMLLALSCGKGPVPKSSPAPGSRLGPPAATHPGSTSRRPEAGSPLASPVVARASSGGQPPPDIEGPFSEHLARYRDADYPRLLSELGIEKPNQPELGFDPTRVAYFDRIERELALTSEEREIYRREGLVNVDHAQRYSMASAYFAIYARDLPVLVTTDSILHALHRSYDEVLKDLEIEVFVPTLERALSQAHEALGRHRAEFVSQALRDNASDVDLYLSVAQSLLGGAGAPVAKAGGEPLAGVQGQPVKEVQPTFAPESELQRILSKIASLKLDDPDHPSALYGGRRPIDYSQFRPRGHYTQAPILEAYFRAMMWLGRADTAFYMAAPDPRSSLEVDWKREANSAALFTLVLKESGAADSLDRLRHVIDYMVGRADNVEIGDMAAALDRVGISTPSALSDPALSAKLAPELAAFAAPRIRSQVITSPRGATAAVPQPKALQIFGQRFVLDSYVLSNVVFDSIDYHGIKQERMMPTGLDVMAALGNDEALRLLEPQLQKYHYSANLLALRKTIDGLPDASWSSDLYGSWLSALRALDDRAEVPGVPRVMRRLAWQRKQLQTQLASWTELRHDTILYAKQSYTAWPTCGYPAGFVEPYPEFFTRTAAFARRAARLLRDTEVKLDSAEEEQRARKSRDAKTAFFERFADIVEVLARLAQKELDSKPFTQEEELFLQSTFDKRGGGSGLPRYDGWYPRLIYGTPDQYKPSVADVHTDPHGGQVLVEAVGDVNFLVVAIDNQGDHAAYVGPVYSYYETTASTAARPTDEEWARSIVSGKLPPRPPFTSLYRAKPVQRELGPRVDERRIQDPKVKRLKELWKRFSVSSPAGQKSLYPLIDKLTDEIGNPAIPRAVPESGDQSPPSSRRRPANERP